MVVFENFRSNMGLFYELPEDKNFQEIQEVYDSELILEHGNIIKLKICLIGKIIKVY